VGMIPHTDAEHVSRMLLHDLYRKLVTNGLECSNTTTIIKDYRLSIFPTFYRRCNEPTWWGDILPSGPLRNRIENRFGQIVECYQWKAGDNNVQQQRLGGMFGVAIQAN